MQANRDAGRTIKLTDQAGAYQSGPARGAPGIVVIQEAFGVNAFVRATCDRFADAGYHAIAPDYFHGRTFDYADRENAIAAVNDVDDDLAMRETAARAGRAGRARRAPRPARGHRVLHGRASRFPRERDAQGTRLPRRSRSTEAESHRPSPKASASRCSIASRGTCAGVTDLRREGRVDRTRGACAPRPCAHRGEQALHARRVPGCAARVRDVRSRKLPEGGGRRRVAHGGCLPGRLRVDRKRGK